MNFLLFAGKAWSDDHQDCVLIALLAVVVLGLIAAYPN